MPVDRVNELLGMMKGKKILVKENHDKKYAPELFEEIYNLHNREDNVLRYDVGIDANGFYSVSVKQISSYDYYHIKKIFEDSELQEDSVIRNFRITASFCNDKFYFKEI